MVDMKRKLIFCLAGLLVSVLMVPIFADNLQKGTDFFLYNNPKEAIPLLEKALYEDPNNQSIYVMLSTAYSQTNQYDKAITILKTSGLFLDFE